MAEKLVLTIFLVFYLISGREALPEQGIFDLKFTGQMDLGYITKSMFNKTDIGVRIECHPKPETKGTQVYVEIRWVLYWAQCIEELAENKYIEKIVKNELNLVGYDNKSHQVFVSDWEQHECKDFIHIGDKSEAMPKDFSDYEWDDDDYDYYDDYSTSWPETTTVKATGSKSSPEAADKGEKTTLDKAGVNNPTLSQDGKATGAQDGNPTGAQTNAQNQVAAGEGVDKTETGSAGKAETVPQKTRKRRASDKKEKKKEKSKKETTTTETAAAGTMKPGMPQDVQRVTKTNHDGPHLFAMVMRASSAPDDYEAEVTIYTKGPRGYLSAIEWPLLPFYGVMSGVYLFFGVTWLIMMFMNWRDLLRVQFWIGGVILIGMLEKAVFFGEFQSVNATGRSLFGALILAEIVSALKRSLARVLVIIVSLGFGIVKPRLGPVLHKVVAVGTLYFIMGSIEGILRVVKERNGREAMLASIPLAVIDAAICWWVFTSLVQVMRTLRLRRNIVKLSLYRHFTNTLIFAVLASIVYMIWSIKQHRLVACMTDWREIWVDDAFWHILFCIILGVIIVLWRPSANNQRFAFSPLLDGANDEEVPEDEEKLITDAYDGMKKRNEKAKVIPYRDNDTDKDLQWIDENIPASVADSALPSLLDSDEEVVTTKYEMSKME